MKKPGKAKGFNNKQIDAVLAFLSTTRWPQRNKVIFLLAVRAGLRPCEISRLTWDDVLEYDKKTISGEIIIPKEITKKTMNKNNIFVHEERTICMADDLIEALQILYNDMRREYVKPEDRIIYNQESASMTPAGISQLFNYWLTRCMKWKNYSAYSGRRTFITKNARNIILAGGSLHDVMRMAGHKSLNTTQIYIEENKEAQRKSVNMT